MTKTIFVLTVFLCTLSACIVPKIHGNGNRKSETRGLSGFASIVCDGGYDIHVECQSAEQSVQVATDENLLQYIKTEVKNGALHISTKGNIAPTKGILITVFTPQLSQFDVDGSADGYILNIKNSAFAVEINGSSRLNITGTTGRLKLHINGSGKINADSLISQDAKIHITGSGDIRVFTKQSIDARIDGSGTIKYSGEPASVKQAVNGSGTIEKK